MLTESEVRNLLKDSGFIPDHAAGSCQTPKKCGQMGAARARWPIFGQKKGCHEGIL
jgi:hypothetical protein